MRPAPPGQIPSGAQARAALRRWREVLAGLVLALLALWLASATFGVTRWIAAALGALGLALAFAATQRLRFERGGGGPGIVRIDERRLVYWGPLTGGAIDMGDLARLDLDPAAKPPHWLLTTLSGEALAVPVTAEGAGALLDLFAALPGLHVEAMLAALDRRGGAPVTLWRASAPARGPRLLS